MTHLSRAIEAGAKAAMAHPDMMTFGMAMDISAAVITAYEAHLAAEGFVVVPKEPTEDMLARGAAECLDRLYSNVPIYDEGDLARDVYRAMIAASQEPSNAHPPKVEG